MVKKEKPIVGILALQGDFAEHEAMLQRIHIPTQQVRLPQDLHHIDRLIIPGGESTTIGKLLVLYDLLTPIKKRIQQGMPVWGTCAGAILLAKTIAEGRPEGQPSLSLMDITAVRNGYGRQVDSFESEVKIPSIGKELFPAVFIRAPLLKSPGKQVKVLAILTNGNIIAAQQNNMLATCFHPELSEDTRLHEYFLKM